MFGGGRQALRRLGFAIALSASASACAEFGAHPKCPAKGGSPWAQIDSPHFTVVSDLPRDQAESMARDLEEGLDALTQIAFEHAKIPVEHTTIVDFQDDSDFHAFLPKLVDGAFYRSLPNDPEVLDTYASALYELGRLAEAIDIQEAAVSFLDEHAKNQEIIDRLDIYRSEAH